MAKNRNKYDAITAGLTRFDKDHVDRLLRYSTETLDIISDYISPLIELGYARPLPKNSLFRFDRFENVKNQSNTVLRQLASVIEAKIVEGIEIEWRRANTKHNTLVDELFSSGRIPKDKLDRFKPVNADALEQFKRRATDGIKLSNKVWKITQQFKTEVENTISAGLIRGQSAREMAKELRSNLSEPDRIFRRRKDEKGMLRLSNRAKNYHPGQGVYRSSVKNAQRLTRTEINIAYRTNDGLRWSSQDFVRGVRVSLSPQHPRPDICDKLKGDYPKNFKFVGWHPQCICTSIPILITEKELDALELADLNDIPYETPNVIKDIPQGLKDWVKDNSERAKGWKNMPYFIRDNFEKGNINGKYEGGF